MQAQPEDLIEFEGRGPEPRTLRLRVYEILEVGRPGDHASAFFDIFMVVLIIANVVVFAADTDPDIAINWGREFHIFNVVSVLIFAVEYLARLWSSLEYPPLSRMPPWKARLKVATSPGMIVDLVVILPFFLYPVIGAYPVLLRVMRLLRFLKLGRYSPALTTIGNVLIREWRALTGALFIMLALLTLSATIMYLLERHAQPAAFGTVPRAMWWAITTLTTVGFGDAVPITTAGRLFGGVVMLLGLGMFALPIAIISTSFAQEIHRRDFVITWGLVARVPIFAGLDAKTIGDLTQLLQAQVLEMGAVIGQRGDLVDGMHFIMSGEVHVHLPHGLARLGEGEFFGEMALLRQHRRSVDITAATRCRLLKLEGPDFTRFMRRHPDVSEKILKVAWQRYSHYRELHPGSADAPIEELDRFARDHGLDGGRKAEPADHGIFSHHGKPEK